MWASVDAKGWESHRPLLQHVSAEGEKAVNANDGYSEIDGSSVIDERHVRVYSLRR